MRATLGGGGASPGQRAWLRMRCPPSTSTKLGRRAQSTSGLAHRVQPCESPAFFGLLAPPILDRPNLPVVRQARDGSNDRNCASDCLPSAPGRLRSRLPPTRDGGRSWKHAAAVPATHTTERTSACILSLARSMPSCLEGGAAAAQLFCGLGDSTVVGSMLSTARAEGGAAAADEAAAALAAGVGGIDALLALAAADGDEQGMAAQLLALLASYGGPVLMTSLEGAGGAAALLNLAECPRCCGPACVALSHFAPSSTAAREAVEAAGGIDRLERLLSSSSTAVVAHAAWLLAQLLGRDHPPSQPPGSDEQGALGALLQLLRRAPLLAAAEALKRLAASGVAALDGIGRARGVDVLVGLALGSDPAVQQVAADTLGLLAPVLGRHVHREDVQAMSALAKLLPSTAPPADPAAAARRRAEVEQWRQAAKARVDAVLLAKGITPTRLVVIGPKRDDTYGSGDPAVRRHAAAALVRIVVGAAASTTVHEAAVGGGPGLVRLLLSASGAEQHHALALLAAMVPTQAAGISHELAEAGAVPLLVGQLGSCNAATSALAAKLLLTVSSNPWERDRIPPAGGIQALACLLLRTADTSASTSQADLADKLAKALWDLARSEPTNRATMLAAGVLPALEGMGERCFEARELAGLLRALASTPAADVQPGAQPGVDPLLLPGRGCMPRAALPCFPGRCGVSYLG